MSKLGPMIDWPPGEAARRIKELDTRMVMCVLDGYTECAAKTPEACICSQMPATAYLSKLNRKYGRVDE